MAGPGLDADYTLDEGSLESVDSLLDASFFGDEVVELLSCDCRSYEDVVDWRETASGGDAGLGVCDNSVGSVEGLLEDGGVGFES